VPRLAAGEDASADMQALCDSYALPIGSAAWCLSRSRSSSSLCDRAVPFGEAAPDAVQFFEAYSVKDGACIWELSDAATISG
jgi:hypothetical protein